MSTTKQRILCFTNLSLLFLPLFLQILTNCNVNGQQSDWLQSCQSDCQCTWKDGKKTAYCKSKGLRAIPSSLSSEVQVIDLYNNYIHNIKKENFLQANLPNLHKIGLKNCSIESLHPNAFKGLAVLIELDLSNNFIDKLPIGIFNDLEKLRTLILSSNLIKVLPQYILSDLPSLSRVDIKNNNLRIIDPYAFRNLSSLANIHLDNNDLSVLAKDTFSNLSKLIDLSLSGNPWNCSCELKEFKDFVIQKHLYTPSTKCSEPKSLQGLRWNEIKSESFACKPFILYPQRNFNIDASGLNDVVLKCRVKGTPKVDLNWIYNNRVIYSTIWKSTESNKYRILNSNSRDSQNSITNEIQIFNLSQSDYGEYICRVNNSGGESETNIFVTTTYTTPTMFNANNVTSSTNSIAFISIVLILTAIVVIIVVFVICVYWRVQIRSKGKNSSYRKHPVLNSSVIVDMQGKTDLLDETAQLTKQHNGSIEIIKKHDVSIEEPKTKTNNYDYKHLPTEYQLDNALPPDLLSFPTYSTLRSIPKDSLSVQLPQDYIYGSTKENSPIYNRYITSPNPNYIRPANRVHSPFNQAPIIYSPLVVKQQYMTIPRKSRAQWSYTSCSPSPSGVNATRRQSTSDFIESEPVYDNLGLRTTAGGNSTLSLQKTTPLKYSISMKDRPLPETPISLKEGAATADNNFKIYEPINEMQASLDNNSVLPIKLSAKLPPKPPPKPAKKILPAEMNEPKGTFDDEDENGTEV